MPASVSCPGQLGRWRGVEHADDRRHFLLYQSPRRQQRLLATADWDPDLVRDDLRAYVVGHLGEEGSERARRQQPRRAMGVAGLGRAGHTASHRIDALTGETS